jgi:ribosomal-protein-alanine N-acetyltransferase
MRFSQAPDFQHDAVCLRPIELPDLDSWAAYLRSPIVYQFTSWDLHDTKELEPFVWQAQEHGPDSLLRLALADRTTAQLVGTVGFHTVSAVNRSAELSYDLAPSHWGRGIASAAAAALTKWAHQHASVLRVQATVLETNQRSLRVVERCGFQREGLLMSYRQVRGQAGNFWMYSHLANA